MNEAYLEGGDRVYEELGKILRRRLLSSLADLADSHCIHPAYQKCPRIRPPEIAAVVFGERRWGSLPLDEAQGAPGVQIVDPNSRVRGPRYELSHPGDGTYSAFGVAQNRELHPGKKGLLVKNKLVVPGYELLGPRFRVAGVDCDGLDETT